MKSIVTKDLVERALERAYEKVLETLRKSAHDEPKLVCSVVLDPLTGNKVSETTYFIGDEVTRDKWKRPYNEIALSKAEISHRTKTSSRVAARSMPALLQETDTFFAGGVCYNGIPVGSSGLSEDEDEKVSIIIAEEIQVLLLMKIEARRQRRDAFLNRH